MRYRSFGFFIGFSAVAPIACAEAWVQAKGQGQLIVTATAEEASKGYDDQSQLRPLTQDWQVNTAQIYGEYGLSDRVTLVFKAQAQDLDTAYAHGKFTGPYEIGLRYRVWHNTHNVVSASLSAEGFSRSRRNDGDSSVVSGTDYRLGLAYGRSFLTSYGEAFIDSHLARQFRASEPDQWRYGVTLGLKPDARTLWLAQGFGGQTDRVPGVPPYGWNVAQLSYVRDVGHKGDLKAQIGIKKTIEGRNVPSMVGVFIAFWKMF